MGREFELFAEIGKIRIRLLGTPGSVGSPNFIRVDDGTKGLTFIATKKTGTNDSVEGEETVSILTPDLS